MGGADLKCPKIPALLPPGHSLLSFGAEQKPNGMEPNCCCFAFPKRLELNPAGSWLRGQAWQGNFSKGKEMVFPRFPCFPQVKLPSRASQQLLPPPRNLRASPNRYLIKELNLIDAQPPQFSGEAAEAHGWPEPGSIAVISPGQALSLCPHRATKGQCGTARDATSPRVTLHKRAEQKTVVLPV